MSIVKFSASAKYRIDEQFQNLPFFRNLDNFEKIFNF